MSRKEGYTHFHETTSDWFKDQFVRFNADDNDEARDAHHHRITDNLTGKSGDGYGWTYRKARDEAWEDLLNKIGDESVWLKG